MRPVRDTNARYNMSVARSEPTILMKKTKRNRRVRKTMDQSMHVRKNKRPISVSSRCGLRNTHTMPGLLFQT